uniref:Uncharacterized protein n=1 Tax=Panagrolaimus sp. JU765 TaxID=591449 RepID=A0AC34R9F3_9BILA
MPKRKAENVNDEVPSSKKQNLNFVPQKTEKLFKAEQKMKTLGVTLQKTKCEFEIWKNLMKKCRQKMKEKRIAVSKLSNQFKTSKESFLKIVSEKNRSINPVQLSPALYVDVFDSAFRQKGDVIRLETIFHLFFIGKDAGISIIQLLRCCTKLTLCDLKIVIENCERIFNFYCCNFSKKLVQLVAPYATEVFIKGGDSGIFHRLFFEALSKDQKQKNLTIVHLRKIDIFVMKSLKKMNEKNIPIKLCEPSMQLL